MSTAPEDPWKPSGPEPVWPPPEADRKPAAPRRRGKNRVSGKSAASEEAEKNAEDLTAPVEEGQLPEEREEWFRAPGFQRMRTALEGEDASQMRRIQGLIDRQVQDTFPEAYAIMSDLYDIVREPAVDPASGEVLKDGYGFTVWARHPVTGAYLEDWTLLTSRQKEDFLFRIVTSLFEWEQRAGTLWTSAMFAKAMFTERFAIEYDAPIQGTIEDRNARGNVEAAEDRYFALMTAAVSRRADAVIRTMTTLQLRLRDVMGQ